MRTKFIAAFLCAAVMLQSAAAFSDISNPAVRRTAAALQSMEIMQGDGNGYFSPDRTLSRCEFVKIAVLGLGMQDVTPYRNYTVFPDVPSAHWAAGYVNAAVKNTDLSKVRIVRGNADGTFRPDGQVTLGEACTMLLRMLGYEETDIGPVWPNDYVSRADALGLLNGVTVSGANAQVSRGNAAILLQNTLTAEKKDGGMLLTALGASTTQDCILLATEDTDSDLTAGQIRVYQDGEITTMTAVSKLDSALIGVRGTVVFDKKQTSRVKSLIPDNLSVETVTVRSADAQKLVTEDKTLTVDRKVTVVSDGEAHSYNEAWFDLQAGDLVNLYYDKTHKLELIAKTDSYAVGASFVYGVSGATNIPSSYEIMRNGVAVDRSSLRQYDVVNFDGGNRRALVSDSKLTGVYNEASPSFRAPESITMLGKKFQISQQVASSFAEFKQGDRITLLLDASGRVCAAYPQSTVLADNKGVVIAADGSKMTVRLFNGLTITETVSDSEKSAVGKVVAVSQNTDGSARISTSTVRKVSGTWDVKAGKLGPATVSPSVRLYERISEKAPLHEVSLSDLGRTSVPTNAISETVTDSSGTVTCIILNDVTGDGWFYGVPTYRDGKVTINGLKGGEAYSYSFDTQDKPSNISGTPIGIPNNQSASVMWEFVPILKLKAVGSVTRDAFDGYTGVTVKGAYYEMIDDVPVYVTNIKKTITLRQAKADFDSFILYANDTAENGGKIRYITVNN